jgi:riboflavin biosynthesis pyrimidine reductase
MATTPTLRADRRQEARTIDEMIQLYPFIVDDDGNPGPGTVDDVSAAVMAEARPPHPSRPWVYTNMIASADGGTAVSGLSGALGGPGDREVFAALRSVADVILVGASTVRDERYRPPRRPEVVRSRRVAEGRQPDPRVAVVTRSLDLDAGLPLFGDPANRPLIVTVTSAPADRRRALSAVADLVDAGSDDVDLGRALRLLATDGVRTVLGEGGPSLNGQLIDAGLVDEWNLSLSPHLLAGDSHRAAVGPVPEGPPPAMRLARVWTDDDYLFCRWVRDPSGR